MALPTNCILIADTRERNVVLRHEKELEKISYEVKQITTGDYAVLSPAGNIMAVIERKSLEDYGASIKDGRSNNKRKLVELRAQTGCRIIFLIEGPEFPDPNTCFGNIPYRYIESSIFHLMIRDNVTVMRTRDTLDTAKTLARFVHSMDSLCQKMEDPTECDAEELAPIETIIRGSSNYPPTPKEAIDTAVSMLTRKHEKTDHEVVRELWACFPGIAVESADEYMKSWSLADIISGRISRAHIENFKLASGRKIGKKAVTSLTNVTKLLQTRLLAHVPGISMVSAPIILESADLRNLLSWGVTGLGMVIATKGKKRLGDKVAERIIRLFNYKYTPHATHPVRNDDIPAIKIDDADVNALLDLC